MGIIQSNLAERTQRYWKASLAWKGIGNWDEGWTTGDFIQECRYIASDQRSVGRLGDDLLDDVIRDAARHKILHEEPARVYQFTKIVGHSTLRQANA